MLIMKINETKRPEEIQSILADALEKFKKFMVWQRDEDGHVIFQVQAELSRIHKNGVYQFDLNSEIQITPDLPVYFAVMDSSLVFKTGNVENAKRVLLLNTPEEVKYKERRKHQRKTFKYASDKKHVEVQFSPLDKNLSEDPKFQSEILDISEGGMCIIMTEDAFEKLDQSIPLELKSLNSDIRLGSEYAQVMNCRPYKGTSINKGKILAIGLMFVLDTDLTKA